VTVKNVLHGSKLLKTEAELKNNASFLTKTLSCTHPLFKNSQRGNEKAGSSIGSRGAKLGKDYCTHPLFKNCQRGNEKAGSSIGSHGANLKKEH
jgi:hypothetical protein